MKLRNRFDRPDVVVIDDFLTKRDFRELKAYMEGSCVWGPRLDLSKEQERDHKLQLWIFQLQFLTMIMITSGMTMIQKLTS